MPALHLDKETFPLRGVFRISRGAKSRADVLVATIRDGAHRGRGECVPYRRYGETFEKVTAHIESARAAVEQGATRADLMDLLPGGAARNALDCALWDLEAQRTGKPVYELAGLLAPEPLTTAFTIGLDTPEKMAEDARKEAHRPLLKLKLGEGDADLARAQAVRAAAPDATLVVDANEGWKPHQLPDLFKGFAALDIRMVEQPLPAGKDGVLSEIARPVPVCADESCHDRASLPELKGRYDIVNIKLDKTGGLTEALALREAARAEGFGVMVGCMVATSLAMAPALLVAQGADFTDVDGPLMMRQDRDPGLRYEGSTVYPAEAGLWG